MGLGGLHMFQGNFRLNHAAPPFDDPAVRRVLWKLVDQQAMLQAIGVPERYAVADCTSFWMCGSPLETKAGSEVFRYSVDAARDELKRTNYAGEPVVMLQVSGSISQTAAKVLAQAMRQAGFVVPAQAIAQLEGPRQAVRRACEVVVHRKQGVVDVVAKAAGDGRGRKVRVEMVTSDSSTTFRAPPSGCQLQRRLGQDKGRR